LDAVFLTKFLLDDRGPVGLLAAIVFGVGMGIYAFSTWSGATQDWPSRSTKRLVLTIAVAVVTLFAFPLTLPVLAVMLFVASTRQVVPNLRWEQITKQNEQNFALAVEQWQRRVVEFELSDRRRFEQAKDWYPVQPDPATLTCVFGGGSIRGSFASWELMLTTLGASLLGSGQRVTIVNLSRRQPATTLLQLVDWANSDGRRQVPVLQLSLPADSGHPRLSRGLDYDLLASILVEVLHSQQGDADTSMRERQEDRSVLREVAAKLIPNGSVSVPRLRAALRAVLREGEGEVGFGEARLSAAEQDRLAELYGAAQREHGGIVERVARLTRRLGDLPPLSFADPGSSSAPGNWHAPSGPALEILDVAADDSLDNEVGRELLFQLVLQSVRRHKKSVDESTDDSPDVLILTGADHIRGQALVALHDYAERAGTDTMFLFERLREDAAQLLGTGGSRAAFLRLANPHDASEACEFIGRSHRWVESQYSRNSSESITNNWGTSQSQSFGMGSSSTNVGTNEGANFSGTTGETSTSQRVYENVIEPSVLQGMPLNMLMFVEIDRDGQRLVTNADFNPEIAAQPRTAQLPRGRA